MSAGQGAPQDPAPARRPRLAGGARGAASVTAESPPREFPR